ncbi:MAG TPA: SH3 domain-containing protein [Leptospiraceae bacterium]|nr:SH3 domain-containing protein [Leptospiraceae bacterium]HMW05117.1 SH3 domain-containing protein [Leptospiraceae bacterium]HMX31371.1 SH3 domain-containing protein [Leptospiraceae bacterium]HMY31586.1 SH3 domain-containing protein [Leptospiraceae bacterium]HMZ66853.1 SH3 domain-containing protein [Leptospiraceae bacterium]
MKKVILLILILSLLHCKKEVEKPKNEIQFLFTDSLTGTNLYENPEPDSNIISSIPHATKVEILPENPAYTITKENTIKWRKIKFDTFVGWVMDNLLSAKVEKHYFSVLTNAGLPLREKPDVKSNKIATIPFGYIGEFYNKTKENVILDKQPGFWIETTYNGKKGWIFSGSAAISKNLQSLEERNGEFGEEGWFYRFYSNLEESKLEEVEFDLKNIENTAKITQFENHPYTIYQIKRQVAEDDCSGKESQIIFKNNITGKSFGNREIFSETVVEQNYPLVRSVYTTSIPQKCGCLIQDSTLYFLLDDRVLATTFHNKDTKAYCEYGTVSNIELERENRYDLANNTLYMYLKLPDCQPDEKTILYGGKITNIKKFKTDMFVSLKLSNTEVMIEKFYQKGIPEQFKTAWESSVKEPNLVKE